VQRVLRGLGRPLPELVDQPIPRDDLVRVQEEDREQRLLPRPGDRNPATAVQHFEEPQDPKVDGGLLRVCVSRASGGSQADVRGDDERAATRESCERPEIHPYQKRALTPIALVAAALVAAAQPASGSRTAPSPARGIETLAAAAARQPPVAALRRGEQRHRRWRGTTLVTAAGPQGSFSRLEYRISEQWAKPDGSGRWRATCWASVLVGPRDRARWRAAGSPDDAICGQDDERADAGMLDSGVPLAHDLQALPTDLGALEARVRGVARSSGRWLDDGETFTLLGELLQLPEASPRLRAALIRLAGRLARLEYLGRVRDPAGRAGVALAMRRGALRHELILAPRTAAVLAERTVAEGPLDWADARPGSVLIWVAYLESSVVRSTGAAVGVQAQASASARRSAG